MKFSELEIEQKIPYKTFSAFGKDITVKEYLPASDKYDLIKITLQEAEEEDGTYNDFKLTVYFNLNIVYMYTNIEFEKTDKEDEMKLYDTLMQSGLIDEILSRIPKKEYSELYSSINTEVTNSLQYGNSFGVILNKILKELPSSIEKATEIVKNFNREDYQNVIDFAKEANGGRPIPVNNTIDINKLINLKNQFEEQK
jgi:hypothetical protein